MSNPYLTKVFYFNAAHQYGHKEWSQEKNWEVKYYNNVKNEYKNVINNNESPTLI